MGKPRKTEKEKLSDQIRVVADETGHNLIKSLDEPIKWNASIDLEYGPHTLLKLAYMNYYMGLFTRIAKKWKKDGFFNKIVFLDAFGGSGLVRIRNTNYTVLGSSLLARMNPAFDKVISVEIDHKRASILEKRMKFASSDDSEVKHGDINDEIESIVDREVDDRTIVFFFVDPEGMEPEFSKLKCLMDKTQYVDMILNFTWGVYRLDGRIREKFNPKDVDKMRTLLPSYSPGGDLNQAALETFNTMIGKPYGDKTDVHSIGARTEYSMILRLRKTQSDTSWLKPMIEFGRIISKYDGKYALKLLREVKGDQSTLI